MFLGLTHLALAASVRQWPTVVYWHKLAGAPLVSRRVCGLRYMDLRASHAMFRRR